MKLLEDTDDLDLEAGEKYQPLYDQLFVKDYSYVQKIWSTSYRKFEELMEIYPDPTPSQVTQTVASGGFDNLSFEPVNESPAENPSHQDSFAQDTSAPV